MKANPEFAKKLKTLHSQVSARQRCRAHRARFGTLLEALALVAQPAAAGDDADHLRRRAPAQRRRARACRAASPGATRSPSCCSTCMTLLAAPLAAARGPAHPRRHPAARPAAALAYACEWLADVLGFACCAVHGLATAPRRRGRATQSARMLDQDAGDAGVVDRWRRCRSASCCSRSSSCSACGACAGRARAARGRGERRMMREPCEPWASPPGCCSAARPCCCSSACRSRSRSSSINMLGAWLWLGGEPGLVQLARNSVSSVTSFSLTPIPLFVLMGEVLFHTGLAVKVIDGIERLIAQVPGRLAVVAVVAGTVFSAISGSTIATTAMLGSLMVPVMLSRGYHPTLATGPVMAIGAVDMLIPPSALDRAARLALRHLDLEAPDRRRRARPAAVGRLRRLHHRPRADSRRSSRRTSTLVAPPRLRPLQAVPALRAAAGLDLRRRRRRDGGGLGHAHRIGGGRRASRRSCWRSSTAR